MLHTSCFTQHSLRQFLRQEYALEIIEISVIPQGSACLFLALCADEQRYVIKEYQRGFDSRAVHREASLCDFLREKGLPTARFIPTHSGEMASTNQGRQVTVHAYIQGDAPQSHSATPWLMQASAQLLGKIHWAMRELPDMQQQFSPAWAAADKIPAKQQEYRLLLAKAECLEHSQSERIAEDLRFRLSALNWLAAQPNVTEGLTYVNTHGDYSIHQLLTKDGYIVAVLDFVGACRLPAAWEVIRSFSLADPQCANGALPADRLEAYVDAYEAVCALSAADRRNMRRFYAAQLLRSSYGYKQFFDPTIADREELLRFGFWRTNLLHTLLAAQ
ncbi:MAG: phosphotransferase [Oscillospiraceae bacterium]|nr:phosphotransferase [Oscillospiraceae bacterium]